MRKTYSFKIQPQEVDFQYHVTLASLTDILLTAAGYNADENGFGIRDLNKINCSWVLLRLAVEMDVFPKQYDNIYVETWVEEVGRASTIRNFLIKNQDNNTIGKAVSNWAMIDINTRRAQDLISLNGIHLFANGQKAGIDKPVKLTTIDTEPADIFSAKYSHIDINGHVSSMRYVEWISNCITLEQYHQFKIKRFEINYLNEILYNDKVSVLYSEDSENDFRFEIRKNGATACKARIVLN